MTKEQIEKKAKEIAWQTSKHYDPNACKQEWCEMAAIDMACWLRSHQWVSVEDELPPKGEIVIAHYGNFSSVGLTFACWDGKGWKQNERDVTHWMHIPLLLAEEGGQR